MSTSTEHLVTPANHLPAEVDMILSALEAGGAFATDRRGARRRSYRVEARLRLFTDPMGSTPKTLYTRDLSRRGVGFITRSRLPLGYGGIVDMPGPNGNESSVHCTLLRCREVAPGWFEGSLYFNREQEDFD